MPLLRKLSSLIADFVGVVSLGLGTVLLSTYGNLPDETPKWIVGIFLVAGVPAVVFGYIFQYLQSKRNSHLKEENKVLKERLSKQIFLVASAVTDHWHNELMQQLLNRLRARQLKPQIFVPSRNHARSEQREILHDVLKSKHEFEAGIIIPALPDGNDDVIADFLDNIHMPVVFADNPPFIDEVRYGTNSVFVGVNSCEGGKLAAEAAVELAKKSPISRILVISSTSQTGRQDEFNRVVKASLTDCQIDQNDGGAFDRSTARQLIRPMLVDAIKQGDPYQLVFCTSDAMALGCLDALRELSNAGNQIATKLISYDGIYETKNAVFDDKSPLFRVVVQDTEELSSRIVDSLINMMRGKKGEAFVWVPPRLHPRIKEIQSKTVAQSSILPAGSEKA